MEDWERVTRRLDKKLSSLEPEFDKNKIVRFYRIKYFTGTTKHGPFPFPRTEENAEIIIYGKEKKAIVKDLGLDYLKNDYALKNVFFDLEIPCLVKEHSDIKGRRTEYSWKAD